MISLEQQVCSLDLANRLKELGVEQESLFYWRIEIDDGEEYPEIWYGDFELRNGLKKYSAFTVAELGELLPDGAYSLKANPKHFWNKKQQKWGCLVTNPATTSLTPVRHSPDGIFARQNCLLRGALQGAKCSHVLHRVVLGVV